MEMSCEKCGAGILKEEVMPEFRRASLGIPGVVLYNAVIATRCDACGDIAEIAIPNLPGLIAAVAAARTCLPVKLDGTAIRFLRRAVGWSGRELAEKLEVAPETVSRWENDAMPIGPTSEKLLRLLVLLRVVTDLPALANKVHDLESMAISSVRCASEPVEIPMQLVPEDVDANPPQWVPEERQIAHA